MEAKQNKESSYYFQLAGRCSAISRKAGLVICKGLLEGRISANASLNFHLLSPSYYDHEQLHMGRNIPFTRQLSPPGCAPQPLTAAQGQNRPWLCAALLGRHQNIGVLSPPSCPDPNAAPWASVKKINEPRQTRWGDREYRRLQLVHAVAISLPPAIPLHLGFVCVPVAVSRHQAVCAATKWAVALLPGCVACTPGTVQTLQLLLYGGSLRALFLPCFWRPFSMFCFPFHATCALSPLLGSLSAHLFICSFCSPFTRLIR